MFEDALEYCEMALTINEEHQNSLHRKAICLAYLFKFDDSIAMFKKINLENRIKFVK